MSNYPPGVSSLPEDQDDYPFEYIDYAFWWSMFEQFSNKYNNIGDLEECLNEIKEDDKAKVKFIDELIMMVDEYINPVDPLFGDRVDENE